MPSNVIAALFPPVPISTSTIKHKSRAMVSVYVVSKLIRSLLDVLFNLTGKKHISSLSSPAQCLKKGKGSVA